MTNKFFNCDSGNICFYDAELREWRELDYIEIEDGIFKRIKSSDLNLNSKHNQYILPGFIDAHCHLLENPYPCDMDGEGRSLASIALNNALVASKNGITSLKDMGGYEYRVLEIIKMLANFKVPRLFSSGCYFTVKHGHCSDHGAIEINDMNEFICGMQPLIDNNVHFCKIINSDNGFSIDLLTRMIEYAHNQEMVVSCHAYTEKAALDAVLAGTDTLEHAGNYSEELLNLIKEKDVIIVPTYVAAYDSTLENCEGMSDINESVLKEWADGENIVIPKLFKQHLRVALGTDSGFLGTPCDSLLREIGLIHNIFGISIHELLYSAFITTPATVGMTEKLGKISEGYYADFVCYDENPVDNLQVLLKPKEVWIGGKRVDNLIEKQIKIRRIRVTDIERISLYMSNYYFNCAELDDFWTPDEIMAWVTDMNDYCTGAFIGDEFVGFCLTHYHATANKVYLENIFVQEQFRRQGIAQYLIFDMISYYREMNQKIRFVGLVDVKNEASIVLCKKNGFVKGHPMYWMQYNAYEKI